MNLKKFLMSSATTALILSAAVPLVAAQENEENNVDVLMEEVAPLMQYHAAGLNLTLNVGDTLESVEALKVPYFLPESKRVNPLEKGFDLIEFPDNALETAAITFDYWHQYYSSMLNSEEVASFTERQEAAYKTLMDEIAPLVDGLHNESLTSEDLEAIRKIDHLTTQYYQEMTKVLYDELGPKLEGKLRELTGPLPESQEETTITHEETVTQAPSVSSEISIEETSTEAPVNNNVNNNNNITINNGSTPGAGQTIPIPFEILRYTNYNLKEGTEQVTQQGVPGIMAADGTILRQPVPQIIEYNPTWEDVKPILSEYSELFGRWVSLTEDGRTLEFNQTQLAEGETVLDVKAVYIRETFNEGRIEYAFRLEEGERVFILDLETLTLADQNGHQYGFEGQEVQHIKSQEKRRTLEDLKAKYEAALTSTTTEEQETTTQEGETTTQEKEETTTKEVETTTQGEESTTKVEETTTKETETTTKEVETTTQAEETTRRQTQTGGTTGGGGVKPNQTQGGGSAGQNGSGQGSVKITKPDGSVVENNQRASYMPTLQDAVTIQADENRSATAIFKNGSMVGTPVNGYATYRIDYIIKNNSQNTMLYFLPKDFRLYNVVKDGETPVEYEINKQEISTTGEIAPGDTIDGIVFFTVPLDVNHYRLTWAPFEDHPEYAEWYFKVSENGQAEKVEQTQPQQTESTTQAAEQTQTGFKLPDTGEVKSWIFQLLGLLLVIGAGAWLFIRREKDKGIDETLEDEE